MNEGSKGRPTLLGRRAVPAVATLVILSFALMAALLMQIARNQDAAAVNRAASFARAAIERRREASAKDVKDYAAWGEAYQHLHLRTDVDWAFAQQNLGATLYKDLGYDDVLVVGPTGEVTYAVVAGELAGQAPPGLIGPALDALVAAARGDGAGEAKPAVGLLVDQGLPLLAAAMAITPGGDPTIVPTPGPPSVLVFVDALTPERLGAIGAQAFVEGLRAGQSADPGASMSLPTVDNAAVVALRWDPERAGQALLRAVLPWLCLTGAAIAVLAALILRGTLRAAMLIEQNARDLTEAHRQAEHAALHDGVTALPNRAKLQLYLERALGEPAKAGHVALVYIDLDRFKPINDAFGHRAGDRVLQETAERLRSVVREGDLVARVGGDEFVLALKGVASGEEVERLCLRLIEAVRAPLVIEDAIVTVGLSTGIAVSPMDGDVAADLLRNADLAMYQAKSEGGNTFRFFSASMNERVTSRLVLETDLRRGLAGNEFIMHFQPRYDTGSMRLLGVEALLRWNHPHRGLLHPSAFLAFAEETGLIVPLGAWALAEACRTVADLPDLIVSVNVSPVQVRAATFAGQVEAALRESGLASNRLELGLTEDALPADLDHGLDILRRLKGLGVRLAMDDFGTGYSSLGYLRRFRFDRLTIGRPFIADLRPAGESRAIVQAILALSRALGLSVTAEGVESLEQLMLLRADHCDEVQGYRLSQPMPAETLRTLVTGRATQEPAQLARAG